MSLEAQTAAADVVVVDNASTDGTADRLSEAFPAVGLVRCEANLGFGRAINRGVAVADGDIVVLVNNDVECEPTFIEHMCAPFAEAQVGMVAGVLLLARDPGRIDTAGIELDPTLGSHDYLSGMPVGVLDASPDPPFGPSGGAAAYRLSAFREVGGFDEAFFAYWEDVELALRLHAAGWRCGFAPAARGVHHHGATLGAASPRARELHAFGRAYVLAKYGVRRRLKTRAQVAMLDYPALLVHALVRRELAPGRARREGAAAGRRARGEGGRGIESISPADIASVTFHEALTRQWRFLWQRLAGRLPAHFRERAGMAQA